MVNDKLIAIDEETRATLETYKVIPQEPIGNVVRKLLEEYKELKARDKWERLTPEERKVKEDQLESERKERLKLSDPTPDPNTANLTPEQTKKVKQDSEFIDAATPDPNTTDSTPSQPLTE